MDSFTVMAVLPPDTDDALDAVVRGQGPYARVFDIVTRGDVALAIIHTQQDRGAVSALQGFLVDLELACNAANVQLPVIQLNVRTN